MTTNNNFLELVTALKYNENLNALDFKKLNLIRYSTAVDKIIDSIARDICQHADRYLSAIIQFESSNLNRISIFAYGFVLQSATETPRLVVIDSKGGFETWSEDGKITSADSDIKSIENLLNRETNELVTKITTKTGTEISSPAIVLPAGGTGGEQEIWNADSTAGFPARGDKRFLYKDNLAAKLYQWVPDVSGSSTGHYESLGIDPFEDIIEINGGNANGTKHA